MKFCPYCGRSCSEHARFCMNCGYCFDVGSTPLRAAPPQAPVPQPPVAAPGPVMPAPPAPPQPIPPRIDPALVETSSSDLYALHRNDGYDPTATGTTFSDYRHNAPTPAQTVRNDDTPRMSKVLWNCLLFGTIGLSVIALIAAVVFYYSNPWI